MSGQLYAALPVEPRSYRRPCLACDGRGVTGERYEMPGDYGPILLVEAEPHIHRHANTLLRIYMVADLQ